MHCGQWRFQQGRDHAIKVNSRLAGCREGTGKQQDVPTQATNLHSRTEHTVSELMELAGAAVCPAQLAMSGVRPAPRPAA